MPPANTLDGNTGELQPNLARGSGETHCLIHNHTADRLYPVLDPDVTPNYNSCTCSDRSMERREENGALDISSKTAGPVSLISYYPKNSELPPFSGSLPVLTPIVNARMNLVSCDRVVPLTQSPTDNRKLSETSPVNKISQTSLMITDSCASLVSSDMDNKDGNNPGHCGPCNENADLPPESIRMMFVQVMIPYLIAGLGMVGAGIVFDKVQRWEVFTDNSAINIVVPPLLGLKGNLEMTLASRLSTLANLGNIDSKKSLLPYVGGNMLISQCLASAIGFITSILAVIIDSIQKQYFRVPQALLLIAASVATAALSSFLLDSIMVSVILISRRFGINPDNVATPIAASLGDITTISLLAGIGSGLYIIKDQIEWVGPLVALAFLILVPMWIFIARRHEYTAQALKTTFMPVLGAMFISTGGGFILAIAINKFDDIAVFQPIINGVGGNLVAIQASRIATSLHQHCPMGLLPATHPSVCINPISIFIGRDTHARCARVLMTLVIPGQLIFIYAVSFISTGKDALPFSFVIVYLAAAVLQVAILLYVATLATYFVWRKKIDPDNFSIPLLTALGDLLGIGLLFIAFLFLEAIGEPVDFISNL